MSSSDRWGENCVFELEGISISWNIYFHSSKKTDLAKLFFNFIFYKTKQSVVFSIKNEQIRPLMEELNCYLSWYPIIPGVYSTVRSTTGV